MEDYTVDTTTDTTVPVPSADDATVQTMPEYYIEGDTTGSMGDDTTTTYDENYEYIMDSTYGDMSQTASPDIDPAMAAAFAGIGLVFFIVWGAVMVFMIMSMWKLFVKAGQPGWAALIPIYNAYILFKMADKPGWWLLLLLIPFVNIVIIFIVWHEISKAFGKDVGFTLGLVFLGIIFLPILAFGSATYRKPEMMTPPAPAV